MSSSPSHLPTGTVTFLFTDIEGSTAMLAELGDRYDRVRDRHAEILRQALAARGGTEVNTEGDAFFAVFRSATDAVDAVTEAQRRLAHEPWPDGATIRVRMGLHSGDGRLGGDDYSGLDVNRAARIASAGHGGQVLLSDATRALVARQLPEGATLRDLGEHRLKDLPAPERIWQLEIEGLDREFPALRSLDARPNNLPLAPTSLIGRTAELEVVDGLLGEHRLLTLTGPGGAGKTRLALAAAHRLLADFADGAYFVGLAEARDRAAVVAAIAAALGVREKPGRDREESVRQYLASRELLLVLDNFEQVLVAAPFVAELLAGAPGIRVVVTSRAALHLSGEQEYEVPPLGLPDPRRLPPLAALSAYEAVALFIDRATAVRSDFAVTSENAPAVAEICARLDGLPLAIELAAARVKLLSPESILERLERSLPLLVGGPSDLPDRQRTLRGTIDWSHELLDPPERRLLARLAVFAGGWTLQAADEVSNPGGELGVDTLDGLASLVDESLVHRVEADPDEPRFTMLQVIREFAAEHLAADPGADLVRERHMRRMLALAEEAEPQLLRAEARRWQARLGRDEDNLRAALRWAIDRSDAEAGLRIAGSLWRFWHYRAQMTEGREWLEAVLALPEAADAGIHRAKALSGLAALFYWQGDAERTEALYQEALALYRLVGDDRSIADAIFDTTWAAVAGNEPALAVERAHDALAQYERAGDAGGAARVSAWLRAGPFIMGMGGDAGEALAATRTASELSAAEGRMFDAADWLGGVAQISYVAGDYEGAGKAARGALERFLEIGNVSLYPMVIRFLAVLELATDGDLRRAVRLSAASDRLFAELGGELPMVTRWGNPAEEARSRLTPEEHARAVAEGAAMSLAEAIAEALSH